MPCLTDLEVLHPRPGVAVVECRGEHDVTSKDALGRLFNDLVIANDLVVIDVSDAEFIDSSFLHNLVKADRLARQHGSRLRCSMARRWLSGELSRSAASSPFWTVSRHARRRSRL